MTYRISIKDIETRVALLNKLTDSPAEPYTRDENGFHANIGNWHLSQAYGGVEVCRMTSEGGGVTCPIWTGHVPKREAYGLLNAFISGLGQA